MWSLSNLRIFNIFYPFPLFSPRSSRGWIQTLDLWYHESIVLPPGPPHWPPSNWQNWKLRGRPVQPHICSVNVAKNISKLFFLLTFPTWVSSYLFPLILTLWKSHRLTKVSVWFVCTTFYFPVTHIEKLMETVWAFARRNNWALYF
jgi:hypothetical protein